MHSSSEQPAIRLEVVVELSQSGTGDLYLNKAQARRIRVMHCSSLLVSQVLDVGAAHLLVSYYGSYISAW